jgi:hypothetical protein
MVNAINWVIFKRHFWEELPRHQKRCRGCRRSLRLLFSHRRMASSPRFQFLAYGGYVAVVCNVLFQQQPCLKCITGLLCPQILCFKRVAGLSKDFGLL